MKVKERRNLIRNKTMVQIINSITQFIWVFFAISIVICLIVAYFLIIYKKKKKKTLEREKDYGVIKIRDSTQFLGFEDIVETPWGAMIVQNEGTRFITAISLRGKSLLYASPQEMSAIKNGMIQFVSSALESDPITIYQEAQPIDLSTMTEKYVEGAENHLELTKSLTNQMEQLQRQMDEISRLPNATSSEESTLLLLEQQYQSLSKERDFHAFMIDAITDIIADCRKNSGKNTSPEYKRSLIFDWTYNPGDFSYSDLTEEQRYEKAAEELYHKGINYINAISAAFVTAEFLSLGDLVDMFRFHQHPETASEIPLSDLINTTYFHNIVCEKKEGQND